MNTGYIKYYRISTEDELYFAEPFTKWQAWRDLLLMACYEDCILYVRGARIEAKRGCVYMSEDNLASRWKWSRGKVRRFLEYLENETKIVQVKSHVTSCISIVKYDEYQDNGTTNSTTNSTTNGTTPIIKNNEEYKENVSSKEETQKKISASADAALSFDVFWEAYDYKKDKKHSVSAWNRLSKSDRDAAIKGIAPYKEDCARNERPMQYPATYLNGRTWEDDFSAPATPKKGEAKKDAMPAGMTEENWKLVQGWLERNCPNLKDITPDEYLSMRGKVRQNKQALTFMLQKMNTVYTGGNVIKVYEGLLDNDMEVKQYLRKVVYGQA